MVREALVDRIPDDWRWVLTTRVTVAVALLVAGLSVVTGVYNIGQETVDGPLAGVVPEGIQHVVGFTGAFTGFLMAGGALALQRRLRAGWYVTLFLMPLTAAQGVLQASQYSLPLVAFSLLSIPLLLVTRPRFTETVSLTATQFAAAGALIGVQLYGTIGTFALRDEFDGVENLLDALFFTVVTSSTVGYGNVVPETAEAQLFTMSLIVLGVASFGIAIGAIVGPALQAKLTKRFGKMSDSHLDVIDRHVLVLGHGELTEPILDELSNSDVAYAVVTADSDVAERLADRDVPVVSADPTDEESVELAKIDRARAVVVATDHDAQDALAILATREVAPDVHVVAAATHHDNAPKLERVGADTVISPTELGGHLLAQSALGTADTGLLDRLIGEGATSERR